MRRFIMSLPGKLLCQLVIMALVLPSLTLAALTKAYAQTVDKPVWAVAEFVDRKGTGTKFGVEAQTALIGELTKSNLFEQVSVEQLNRAVESLGIQSPPRDTTTLLRLAQEVRASTIVSGEIIDYTVVNDASGKQAYVSMRTVVYDVASGLPVNGSAISAKSTIRPLNVDDQTLINDAIASGANASFRDIQSKTLPTATVLNSTPTEAFINQGSRSGFKDGQEVIIIRGREQVATARVVEVDFDSARVKLERSIKGLQPGDKVRAVFAPPTIVPGFGKAGEVKVARGARRVNTGVIVSAILVIGLLALLLGGGNSGGRGQGAANGVVARPRIEGTTPVVDITWSNAGFGINSQALEYWQVYRSGIEDTPVAVIRSGVERAVDTTVARDAPTYFNAPRVVPGDINCGALETIDPAGAIPGAIPGQSYNYSVEAIFRSSNNNGGANAGGNNAGGNNGGQNNGGGGTTNTVACFLRSDRTVSVGRATPLIPPTLGSTPPANTPVTGNQDFVFVPGNNLNTGRYEYVLQISQSNAFVQATTVNVATLSDGTTRFRSVNVTNIFPNFTGALWWRVGVRNLEDNPGPLPDQSGAPYIFGRVQNTNYRSFTRPAGPPPPP